MIQCLSLAVCSYLACKEQFWYFTGKWSKHCDKICMLHNNTPTSASRKVCQWSATCSKYDFQRERKLQPQEFSKPMCEPEEVIQENHGIWI